MEIEEASAKSHLSQIQKLLEKFSWLADSFVLDFYTKNHWSQLPQSWQAYLSDISPSQLADLIDLNVHGIPCCNSTPPPLSLLSLKRTCQALSLPRSHSPLIPNTPPPATPPSPDLTLLLKRHVKAKKRHEIENLSTLLSSLTKLTGSKKAYDIGSGLGHLSRYLTYQHNLKMIAIDKQETLSNSAKKLDTELLSYLKKYPNKERPPPPSHHQLDLDFGTPEKLFNEDCESFGFTGLHACGNLSPLILHNYVNSCADFVVSLGCCYMKMDHRGFPLSRHGKDENLHLSFESLEVACHASEQYCTRLRSGQVKKLITHSYRATLETLLSPLNYSHKPLHSVPHTHTLTFQEYATRATSCLPISLPASSLSSPTIESNLQDWFKVVTFYSLRLLLANVIESAVLLDRALYLKTSRPNDKTYISCCFNPSISARSLAVISFNPNSTLR